MHTDDTQAINAVLKGDKNSYESLIDKHKKMVYGIAWSHLGDSELSEDAAQETFMKAYTYLGTLREPEKFAGWLARIARNVCHSLGRSRKRENAFKERYTVLEKAEIEPRVDEGESIAEPLWTSFAELSPAYREALTAFYIEGRSTVEAADSLGISEQALRTRLHRARAALRDQLERRLEDTLGEIRPSKNFTRSVLALLPLIPKGVAAGGVAAAFGKLLASFSFSVWMAVAGALPAAGLYSLMAKNDESVLGDTPEHDAAKRKIRRDYRNAVIGMAAGMAVVWTLMKPLGFSTVYKMLAVLYGVLTILCIIGAVRQRQSFPSRPIAQLIGGAAVWAIMFAAVTAIAFFGAPLVTFAVAVLAVSIVAIFATPKTPPALQQYGVNLFLRGLQSDAIPDVEEPLDHRLSKLELRTFAKLVCGLSIIKSYRIDGETLVLVTVGMTSSPLAGLGFLAGSSEITVGPDGSCTATLSEVDQKALRDMLGPDADVAALEQGACRAIRYALICFARGDAQAGLDAISVRIDPAVAESPALIRNHRVKLLTGIIMGLCIVAAFASHSGILMFVFSLGGLALAALVLAVNLYITRRQSRSV